MARLLSPVPTSYPRWVSAVVAPIRTAKAMGINPEIVDISLPLLVNLNKGGVAMLISVLSAIIVGGVPGGQKAAAGR